MLIEDPPAQEGKVQDPRSYHIVTCSTRTPYSLKENKRRLRDHLAFHPGIKISDLAYTTTAWRLHDVYRDAHVAQTTQEIVNSLTADLVNHC